MRRLLTYLLLGLWTCQMGYSRGFPEKGVPLLQNYTPAQYHEKGKIWDITSADNGIVYMAADKGLLEYDGIEWNSFKGSSGFTRSLLWINDSIIYTGSDLDFGIWKRNKYQTFEYTSLYPFREDLNEFYEEFWDVYQVGDNILFVSFNNIYIYKNQQLTRLPAPHRFTGSFRANGSLYFADEKAGLFVLNGLTLESVLTLPDEPGLQIAGIYGTAEGIVLVTKSLGLYLHSSGTLTPVNSHLSDRLKAMKVFCFEEIDENLLAYGTVLGGLFVADKEGKIIHHINKQKGLPNNTILGMHYSSGGKLWLGMDYGVSSLSLTSDVTYFIDYRGDFGTGSAAIILDNVFFLGTNQGLYHSDWADLNNDSDFDKFVVVPGTEGQVWTLKSIDNRLFIGHDKGLFILEGMKAQQLSDQPGVWTIIPYKDYLLTGNYNGISVFRKGKHDWEYFRRMDQILGSCNQIIVENEEIIWVNIPNYGIIRAVLDNNLNPVERLIFPEKEFQGNNPYLKLDTQGIQVFTDKYKYSYDDYVKKFSSLQERIAEPLIEGVVSGIYNPLSLNTDYDFYPVYNGFALRFKGMPAGNIRLAYNPVIRKIEAFNNNQRITFFSGAAIPFRLHNLRIAFIVPNHDNALYQYQTDKSGNWSTWSPEKSITLLGLREGDYTISVRAKINGTITDATGISLRIVPPWYRSWYAYAFYALLALFITYIIHLWRNTALKEQREESLKQEEAALRRQSDQHKQEIMRLEKERLQSEYNQLKQELRRKTIDLANKARENEEKNRLLGTLKEKFNLVLKDQADSGNQYREMQKLLDSYLRVDDKTFEIQMDELHQEFFKKLKEQFPGLSSNDLRMCAYLKSGFNSKEIADLLNIQPSSAYISRSRLRKKLNLKVEEDLHDFLFSF